MGRFIFTQNIFLGLQVLALTKITSYSKFVREGIIHHLIDQSLGAEEEEEANAEEKETEEANKADLETGSTVVEDLELEGRLACFPFVWNVVHSVSCITNAQASGMTPSLFLHPWLTMERNTNL